MADDLRQAGLTEVVDLGPLLGSLGFLLRLAQVVNFKELYESFGGHGIKGAEYSALLIIQRNPGIRQGVLAQHLMIKRAHMTKMIRALEDAGHVLRSIPDDDRRSVELRLTPAGNAVVNSHIDAFTSFRTRERETLGEVEEEELKRLLRKYLRLERAA